MWPKTCRRLHIVLAMVVALAVAPLPARAEVATVLLDVPWRSQIDGSADQHDNGALASLGMVLAAHGRAASTASLRQEHDDLAGTLHSPVTDQSLAGLAISHGLQPLPLAGPSATALAQARRYLESGAPVLLSLGPGEPPAGERWVVAVGFTATGNLVYNDPAFPVPAYGQLRLLTSREQQAWLSAGGVGLATLAGPPLPSTPTAQATAASPNPAPRDDSPYWWRQIEAYARWFDLDPYFVAAVVLAESAGNPQAVGDDGHSVGLMQLHDEGFGMGISDLRYDPSLNLWEGTKALAEGMAKYGDPYLAYSRYYNPGGEPQGQRVMDIYYRLRSLEAEEEAPAMDQQPGLGGEVVPSSTTQAPGG
ncbi:MAG: transglycosylase SLT domain-containing protein [Dehalococcoidales bacterium]|nr:transglycosylase SLT domain-containing protein [Dehalococcoidales bacterium]